MGTRLAYPDNYSLFRGAPTMAEKVLLPAGRREGHGKLTGEGAFRQKLAEGAEVYTTLNNVYFLVTLTADDTVKYTALPTAPEGLA